MRDKVLLAAVRGAYGDVLPSGRYPGVVLFLTVPPREVDVNVHPTKAEVRFRDSNLVRGLIVTAIRQALTEAAQFTSSTLAPKAFTMLRPETYAPRCKALLKPGRRRSIGPGLFPAARPLHHRICLPMCRFPCGRLRADRPRLQKCRETGRLGAAVAQVHGTFIIAQTEDSVVSSTSTLRMSALFTRK